jgi:hypothetical protein
MSYTDGSINHLKAHGAFVGVVALKSDTEALRMQIPLSKFRYLVKDCLQLHPFWTIIEKALAVKLEADALEQTKLGLTP